MELDLSNEGEVKKIIVNCLRNVKIDFPRDITGSSDSLDSRHIFVLNKDFNKLYEDQSMAFHN